jgi:hypothetical protein
VNARVEKIVGGGVMVDKLVLRIVMIVSLFFFSTPLLSAETAVTPISKPLSKEQQTFSKPKSTAMQKQADRISPKVQARLKLEVDASSLPPAEPNSYDITLIKDCGAGGSPCWLEASLAPFPIPNSTLDRFKNVNPGVSLWFAYPGNNPSQAPSPTAGVTVASGQELNPVVIGYPANTSLINPALPVVAVAVCNQNGQLTPCNYEKAYLRVYWQ